MNTGELIEILMPDLPEYFEKNEFFLRELELIGKKINHEEDTPLPRNSLIYCNDLKHWEKRLKLSANLSISVIIASNEYYKKEKWIHLNEIQSVKCAFIQYLPSFRKTRFRSILKTIALQPQLVRKKAFWRTMKSASQRYGSMQKLKFRMPVFSFPLGYTERFFLELQKLNLIPADSSSLFAEKSMVNVVERGGISFVGQKGSWYRRFMVDYFEKISNAKTSKYGTFGGITTLPQTTEYAKSILESRFVICPPGNVSSQSFRYFEAIALGAIPIVTEVSIQDWNAHDYWPTTFAWKNSDFMGLWTSLVTQESEFLDQLSKELRLYVLEQLTSTKQMLRACISDNDFHSREDSEN